MLKYLDWTKLLSSERLEVEDSPITENMYEPRSPFERDSSRIIFSDAFRRLGKKTQVHPLSKNDHIHTRLTHSQEVAAFGHSLACCVWDYMEYLSGDVIDDKNGLRLFVKSIKRNSKACNFIQRGFDEIKDSKVGRDGFASIVQAASYAHDIGNPPFDHAGEDAIRGWMKSHEDGVQKVHQEDKQNDIRYFEGNAQGFRLVTNTEGFHDETGLNLTVATLGAMIKYPWTSTKSHPKKRKYNYLQSEMKTIKSMNEKLGLSELEIAEYARHPLSYLMEAADDICYTMIDIEDAIELGILRISDISKLIGYIYDEISVAEKDISKDSDVNKDIKEFYSCTKITLEHVKNTLDEHSVSNELSPRRVMAKYRSPLMNLLTNQISYTFIENYKKIMAGSLEGDLIENSSSKIPMIIINKFKKIAEEIIFNDTMKNEFEVGCNSTIGVLLNSFLLAADDICTNGDNGLTNRNQQILKLMSHHTKISENDGHYIAYLKALDFISGMTDNYASYLSKQLHGIFNI